MSDDDDNDWLDVLNHLAFGVKKTWLKWTDGLLVMDISVWEYLMTKIVFGNFLVFLRLYFRGDFVSGL